MLFDLHFPTVQEFREPRAFCPVHCGDSTTSDHGDPLRFSVSLVLHHWLSQELKAMPGRVARYVMVSALPRTCPNSAA